MICYDDSGVSYIVRSISEVNLIRDYLDSILGMRNNNALQSIDLENISNNSLSILQIYSIELLLSMEKRKHDEAKDIIEVIEAMLQFESDFRALTLAKGSRFLLKGDYYKARYEFNFLFSKNSADIFSFYTCHLIEFNNGMSRAMLDTLYLSGKKWTEASPYYGYYKGIEAFILNENSLHENAYDCGLVALSKNRNDIYAIHAVCHYFYDTKNYVEGRDFMDEQRPYWEVNYGMRIHLYWHYALFVIRVGDFYLLKNIYKSIRKKNVINGLEDLDAASFLFRLSLETDLSDFKEEVENLLQSWSNFKELGFYFFNDFHAALVFSLSNKVEEIDFLIEKIKDNRPFGYLKEKAVVLNAIKSFTIKDYDNVIEILKKPIDYHFMGGSNIQRHIINDILSKSIKEKNGGGDVN